MKSIKSLFLTLILAVSGNLLAVEENALVAISGYDPVSYFTMNKAVRGSGMSTSNYNGQTYLFSSAENKAKFEKSPSKYLPQFGGYCAFGAAMGKKFHSDPTVFAIVNNKLYLNLNKDIQEKWNGDQKKMIKDANANWPKIKSKSAASL